MIRSATLPLALLLTSNAWASTEPPCEPREALALSTEQRASLVEAPQRLGLMARPYKSTREALATNDVASVQAYLSSDHEGMVWGEITYNGPGQTKPVVSCQGRAGESIVWLVCMEPFPEPSVGH